LTVSSRWRASSMAAATLCRAIRLPRWAKDLSWRYRHLAREVGIAHATMPGLFGDDIDALGGRCFIKHYCVPLHGDDIRDQLGQLLRSICCKR
jgi:hypothetical protein